jgi:hypothetical protein
MQLVGKLYRHEGGWKADWIFVDGGRELARWSDEDRNARQALASGADGTADALASRYAKAPETGPPGDYRVVVDGIDSGDDYLRLSAYLQDLSVVRAFRPLRATPGRMEFELSLASGLSGLRRLVSRGDVLVSADAPVDAAADAGATAVPAPGAQARFRMR